MPLSPRHYLRLVTPRLLGAGWSPAAIIRNVASVSGTYRQTDMSGDIREQRNWLTYSKPTIQYRTDRDVPKALMSEIKLTTDAKYRVHGIVKYRDPETGTVLYRDASFYTDSRLSKEDYEQEFINEQIEEASRPDYVVETFSVSLVEHHRGYSY